MLNTDILFNYHNINRFILLHKLGINNSFLVPNLNKFICYFSLKHLDDLNDVRIYNYFFFFKFFLGFRAFFTGYRVTQGFGQTTYDFRIQIILRKNDLYFPLSFFLNDVLSIIDNDYFYFNLKKINNIICSITIKDMNIFSEKKTNLGLFNLKDNLKLRFFLSTPNIAYVKTYFNTMKFYFIK